MIIRNIDDHPGQPVDMEGVSGVRMSVMVGRDDGAPNFALRHFTVEPGGHSPQHSHDFEHEVFVVGGNGTLYFEGDEHPLRAGDVVYVPSEHEHQFRAGPEGLRFLCLVPMSRSCGEPTPGS